MAAKMRIFTTIIIFFFSQVSSASAPLFESAKTFKQGTSLITELQFNQPVEANKASIEFINETIQINIRDAAIATAKLNQPIQDERAESLFVYQAEPNLLRTRIIYKKSTPAQEFDGHVDLTAVDGKIIITVKDPNAAVTADKASEPLRLMPPVDLNSMLEPKISAESPLQQSAASILEDEFLANQKTAPTVSNETLAEKSASPLTGDEKQSLKESEIPLSLEKTKSAAQQESPWMRMILSLIVVSVVGLIAVIVAKRYAKAKVPGLSKVQIQVVSQQALGPKRSLMVIRVAGEDILIGVTDHNVSLIKSLSFIDDEVESTVPRSFVDELNQVTDRYVHNKAVTRGDLIKKPTQASEDEFNMGKIKDMVASKLKEMRPL